MRKKAAMVETAAELPRFFYVLRCHDEGKDIRDFVGGG